MENVLPSTPIPYSGLLIPSSKLFQSGKYFFMYVKPIMLLSDPESQSAINFILLMEIGIVTSEIKDLSLTDRKILKC